MGREENAYELSVGVEFSPLKSRINRLRVEQGRAVLAKNGREVCDDCRMGDVFNGGSRTGLPGHELSDADS